MISSIFQNKVTRNLPQMVGAALTRAGFPISILPEVIGALSGGDTASLLEIPGMRPEIIRSLAAANQQAYADSFRYMWCSLIPFCVLTLLSACFLRSTESQLTQEVASAMQQRHGTRAEKKDTFGEKDV
ncbi:hypothetical protein BJX70DRAFT_374606 [Aspergillus crustosus]